MILRDARCSDAAQILEIYAPVVRNSAISFEMQPPSRMEIEERLEQSTWRFPWLVADVDGTVAGYAYARPFRSRLAYQFTAETTVYIHHDFRQQGIGVRLMQHLLDRLHTAGHHVAVAGIALPNSASVRLHERLGFDPAGVFPAVGRKFDAWHDVGFWSLRLSDQTVVIPPWASGDWRMRRVSPAANVARTLIDNLSMELAERYDHQDDGSGDFDPDHEDQIGSAFVVGWRRESPVACGGIRRLVDRMAELKRMFVSPDHRGEGLAAKVLQRLELEATRLGYTTIKLETGDRQPEAISLYRRCGYRPTEPFGDYVGSERSLCFEKILPQA